MQAKIRQQLQEGLIKGGTQPCGTQNNTNLTYRPTTVRYAKGIRWPDTSNAKSLGEITTQT